KRRSALPFTLASAAGLASGLASLANAAPAELPLHSGWNLISLPLQPTNTAIQSVLAPLQGNYKAVWTYTNGRWYGFNPSVPGLDDLKDMQAGKAYWIQLTDDGVLTLDGIVPVNGANALAGQTLNPGWNLLGYSSGR